MVRVLEVRRLGILAGRSGALLVHGHIDHLREMQRTAVSGLRDLLAAAEASGNDQRVFGSSPHRRQQSMLAYLDRYLIVCLLETK